MAKWELKREKYLSLSEVKQLVKVCEGRASADREKGRLTWPRVWAVVHTGLESGLRVSELKGLDCGDLFLKNGEPYLIVRNGKGGKTRRVSLGSNLKKHLKEFLKWKETAGEETGEDSPVFCSAYKRRFSKRGLQILFKKALSASGLPEHYSIHCLRHTCGTYAYDQTKDLRFVQRLLGHSSPSTTSVYAGVTPEKEAKYINQISDLYQE
jgi:site-specific recombinase XerD